MDPTEFQLSGPRPFFAELPYYLWGQVNYDSDGDCDRPTDREWTELLLENRESNEELEIFEEGGMWSIKGEERLAVRAARFLMERCEAGSSNPAGAMNDERHRQGMKRAKAVATEFGTRELQPFDTHLFWGSWKWIGGFATQFTAPGRLIMHSVVRKDPRAVSLCIDWLRQGTYSPEQSAALRLGLTHLTGVSLKTDKEWIKWYRGGLFSSGNRTRFPAPDMEEWLKEIEGETVELLGANTP